MAIQMAKKIFKYELQILDIQIIDMPANAQILHVDVQSERICLWAVVEPTARLVPRRFHIVGTGHDMPKYVVLQHLGSVLMHQGTFVWHIFEDITK